MNNVIIINNGKIKFTKMTNTDLEILIDVAKTNNFHYMVLKEITKHKTYTVFFGAIVSFKN